MLNSQLQSVQILTSDVQMLILCLSYFIPTVSMKRRNCKSDLSRDNWVFFLAFWCTVVQQWFHPSNSLSTNQNNQTCQAVLSLVETFEEGQNFRRTLIRETDGLDFNNAPSKIYFNPLWVCEFHPRFPNLVMAHQAELQNSTYIYYFYEQLELLRFSSPIFGFTVVII